MHCLVNWIIHCDDLVQSIINLILDNLQQQSVLHIDAKRQQVKGKLDKANGVVYYYFSITIS
jgi:hypothetical protein